MPDVPVDRWSVELPADPADFIFRRAATSADLDAMGNPEPLEEGAAADAKDPTTAERQALKKRVGAKADGVSLKRDARGYFVHTHRARSKSYPSVDAIPASAVEFIESTG